MRMAASETEQSTAAPTPPQPGLVRRLWSAVGVSSLGDGAFLAAVPLAAAAVTRSPLAVASVTAAMYVPWMLVQPVAGALLERWPFRATMLVADGLRALGVAGLAVVVAVGRANIPLLAACAFGIVLGQIFHDGAVQATVPELVGRAGPALDKVNGRVYGSETAGKQLLGPPAGSAGYALAPWLPFAADALSFVVSAALVWRLPRNLRTRPSDDRPPLMASVRAGFAWLARQRQLRLLAVIAATGNLAYNAAWATFVLLATDRHGLNVAAAGFGLFISAYAVGGVVGGLLTGRLNALLRPAPAVVVLAVVHGVAWPLMALAPDGWVAAPLLAVVGAAQTMTTVTNVGLRQVLAPADLLNRVTAAFRTLVNSASPIGAVLGGLVASVWGLRAPLVVAGVVLVVVALAAAPSLWSRDTG
jgi:Transmembrane secretion effector